MLAIAYNLIVLFSALDCSFLHNTILAIIVFQTIKHIDTLPKELWYFVKKHKLFFASCGLFVIYLLLSRLWYDFVETFYYVVINDLQKNILLFILYSFLFAFYSTKIDISGLTKHQYLLIAPIITIPIVFLIDYFTNFSIQEFIYIRKVGIDNLHIGITYYTMLCCFIVSILYTNNKPKLTFIVSGCAMVIITASSMIMQTGKASPIIFVIYLIGFFSYIVYHNWTHKLLLDYHDKKYFFVLTTLLLLLIPIHLLTIKSNLLYSNYGKLPMAHRQCIWNTTYELYKAFPQKLIGHGLNSYQAVHIMDSKTENRINCEHIINKINNSNAKEQKKLNHDEVFANIHSIALHPHSIILQILFELGIIGLFLSIFVLLSTIFELFKQPANGHKQLCIKASTDACFITIIMMSAFSYSLYTFWLWDIALMTMFMLSAIKNNITK